MKKIDITSGILISKDIETVFEYLADYSKEPLWRNEVKNVYMDTDVVMKGTLVKEDAFLSKKIPSYISTFVCTGYEKNKHAIFETTGENTFYQKKMRYVEAAEANKTNVTYRLQFDVAIVKYSLGFALPKFIIDAYTKMLMKKYLKVLKNILEN
ncbi:hypothetical protein BH11BAC3_BH11BAC3_11790 [soil metagenome]